jgi:hypothetical protein
MLEIMVYAPMFSELKPLVTSFCRNYHDQFTKGKADLMKKDGYRLRLEAARLACVHLQKAARERGDIEGAKRYTEETKKYIDERLKISKRKRW